MRVSLTFDDGPNTVTTPQVLDVLEEFGVSASFFLVGSNINDQSAKIIERQMKDGCTIECHSWSHTAFPNLSPLEMMSEVNRTNELIERYSGESPVFFRPPYIALNDIMFDSIKMPFISGAGVDDWILEKSAQEKADGVINNACDGQIILLHDMVGNSTTVEALKILIPRLLESGTEFYNIRELFEKCGVNPYRKNTIWSNVFTC